MSLVASVVAGYTVLCELGQGSYATVYQVRRKDGKLYVLKLVNLTHSGKEEARQQALGEAQILKQLRCP